LGLRHDFVTDGQKRDYLSRASQRARGATKKVDVAMQLGQYVTRNVHGELTSVITIITRHGTAHGLLIDRQLRRRRRRRTNQYNDDVGNMR